MEETKLEGYSETPEVLEEYDMYPDGFKMDSRVSRMRVCTPEWQSKAPVDSEQGHSPFSPIV